MTRSPGLVIKICGLRTPETLAAALAAGADMLGFVFFHKSPRFVAPAQARDLASVVTGPARKVALLVDAEDALVEAVVAALAPNLLQLHGSETPARAAALRRRFGIPVMKAVGIATPADVAQLDRWREAADHLLVDAKPPPGAAFPGGHGRVFDWSMLDGRDPSLRFMLSGGLHPANVADAVRRTAPWGVDVSSGVETAPGHKDPARIRAFVEAARAAGGASPHLASATAG